MGWVGFALTIVCCCILKFAYTYAETPKSSSYQFSESYIDSGSMTDSSSNSYKTTNATGDLVVGNTSSSGYQIETGSQTTNDPSLSFSLDSAGGVFGSFTPTEPTVTTASFSVSNYTSFGYIVQIIGTPPTNNTHTIAAMTDAGSSQIGIEQFGINLVANTSPKTVGADPDNGQFGFGVATDNYKVANQFRYVSGDTIAQAPKSSGVTIYTISYLVNVSSVTPGGQYVSEQTIIITGTY